MLPVWYFPFANMNCGLRGFHLFFRQSFNSSLINRSSCFLSCCVLGSRSLSSSQTISNYMCMLVLYHRRTIRTQHTHATGVSVVAPWPGEDIGPMPEDGAEEVFHDESGESPPRLSTRSCQRERSTRSAKTRSAVTSRVPSFSASARYWQS